jgi:hypothetical protein
VTGIDARLLVLCALGAALPFVALIVVVFLS